MTLSEALRASPFFADLSPWDLEAVRAMMTTQRYAKGRALLTEGQPGEAMFLLLAGRVAVTERDGANGEHRRLQTAEPGEIVGFMSLIDARPQPATCMTLEDVDAAVLTRSAFEMLRAAGAHIAFHLQACIFRHLQREMLVARGALMRGVFGVSARERLHLPHLIA